MLLKYYSIELAGEKYCFIQHKTLTDASPCMYFKMLPTDKVQPPSNINTNNLAITTPSTISLYGSSNTFTAAHLTL
jgi:hypothetical protein